MTRTTLGAALASFVLGAAVALPWADAFARSPRPAKPSVYTDARYGFTISPPAFPKGEKDTAGLTASFFAPAKGGFAANLGVMVQHVAMSAEEYRDLTRDQFKQAGITLVSETMKKIGGRDAILWEYEGKSGTRELRWLGLAVVEAERVTLVTATAPKADFEALSAEFKASIDSFRPGD